MDMEKIWIVITRILNREGCIYEEHQSFQETKAFWSKEEAQKYFNKQIYELGDYIWNRDEPAENEWDDREDYYSVETESYFCFTNIVEVELQ